MSGFLDGYSFAEWPNLSGDRSPESCNNVASKAIPAAGCDASTTDNVNTSMMLLAIARVIGAYCGVTDVLLAVQINQHGSISFIRIKWNEEDTWAELKLRVDQAIRDALGQPMSLDVIRNTLTLDEDQYPYLALCTFDQYDQLQEAQHPPIISYSNLDSVIHLSAPSSTLHPTVSAQFVSQVVDLISQGSKSPSSKFSVVHSLPSELMSMFERGSSSEVAAAYPHVSTVKFAPDYLSERVKDMPNETAVRWYSELSLEDENFEYESISYIDLDKKSNQVARWLLRLGLQPEDRVAVCLDRNLHFHIAMMGIMKAGGCYVPIDPELPLERKTYIAQDANAVFVLTSTVVSSLDVFGSRTLYIEDEASQNEIMHESSDSVNFMDPNGLAYMLYTSGTTGNPKGCLLTHHGLAQATLALSNAASDVQMNNLREGRYLAVASIAFDVHLAETLVPIALGMPLLSARRSQLLENLPLYVKRLGVTHLGIVPSLIEATLNASQGEDEGSDITLRYIASGGEKMSDSILDKWADHPQVRLANFYGPSEVTIGCCARYMTSRTPKGNIGKPFANVSGYVVDANMNVQLRGGMGELVVEGPLVGRGYHGRPDLTEKVFLEWPRKGCWAYRTGDLVRMMPDSTIEILGRIDTQIKLRGVRIESEGISAIVRKAIPPTDNITVDATTVLAKHPAINVDQLVSFFTWDGSVPISTRKSEKPRIAAPPPTFLRQIKDKCEAELPSYMRPSHFIPLSWLPLSSNGKTDAKVLIEFYKKLNVEDIAKLSVSQEGFVETRPCSEAELKVFGVLQNHVAMALETPHPDINIFECGLDSMGVIKFASELKDIFKTKVVAAQVMKAPRIADIALYLEKEVNRTDGQPNLSFDIPALEEIHSLYLPSCIEDVLPSFPVQEGVLSRSADVDTLYVQHVMISCKQDVSLSLLEAAWKSVVDRNQILRTVFHFGRTLSQVVLKPAACGFNWTLKEIADKLDDETFPTYFVANEACIISKSINQNISARPPYQLSVYLSGKSTYLVLSIQHALFDGISLPHIFYQVEREYFGLQPRDEAPFSGILRHINSIDLDLAKAFWENYMSGYHWPQTSLYPGIPVPTQRLTVPFRASLTKVKEMATSKSVTMQALLTCAFAHCLASKVYKQKDVVFGVIRSGRLLPIDHIDKSLSPLVTVLPLRINFGTPQVSLQKIQEGISSMIEYEHLPLGKVQGWVRPGKSVFETLFSVSVNERSESKLWDIIESEPPQADYPLAVEIVIDPFSNSVKLKAAWMDHCAMESPRQWLQGFEDVVSSLVNNTPADISRSLDGLSHISSPKSESGPPQKQLSPDPTIDAALVNTLRGIVANFMGFHPDIVAPSMSLISLGLDSIKSVGLAKAISKAGHQVTSTDILRNATLNELAVFIQEKKAGAHDTITPPSQSILGIDPAILSEITRESVRLSPDEDVQFFPTTALQTGMLSQTVNSKGGLYLHAFPLRLPGAVDIDRLRSAWVKAIQCFAILRTSFHFSTETGVWIQAVHSSPPPDWEVISLESIDDYKPELERFMSSIDLSDETCFRSPPFWVRLFSSSTDGCKEPTAFLVFAMHHCLYDGMSIGKLVLSVQSLYEGGPNPTVTQFHELLPHFLQQEKEGTPFWVNRLRSYNPLKLPRQRETSSETPSATLERTFFLDGDTVRKTLSTTSVTMQCLCQASWAKTLSKYTGSSDVVFGHTVSGRNIPGAEDVIGPVLNTIPCCIRVETETRNIDFLRTIHQSNLDSLAWQQASPRAIQKAMRVESLWDSLFLFQTSEMEDSPPQSWTFDTSTVIDEAKIQYPLNVEISHHGSSITIKCASHPDYIDLAELEMIVEDFQQYIQQILYEPFAMVNTEFLVSSSANVLPIPGQPVAKENLESPISNTTSTLISSSTYEQILMSVTNAPLSLTKLETPLAALGVDSIMAIQIVGKFRQKGMKIVASDVLSSQTIGDMLEKVSVTKNVTKPTRTPKISIIDAEKRDIHEHLKENVKEIENISFMSSGMKWLVGAWQKSLGTRYQHVFAYQLPHDVDISKMKAAWLSLAQRHPILRSTFTLPKGRNEPRLVTFRSLENSWAEELVEDDVFYRSIISRMKSMVETPPSTASPPSRGLLFHSTRKFFLIIQLHHFQYDAWSLQLLMHDLSHLYRGSNPTTSNKMQAFLDYYTPNPQHLSQQEKYWRAHFPVNFKPILFPPFNSNMKSHQSTRRFIKTNASCIQDASRCEDRARSLGVSLQSIFLACWAVLQGQITASTSSTFGIWHSGRTGPVDDIANLAVPCINVLPFHVPGVDVRSIVQIAKWIQTNLLKRTAVIEQSDQVQVNEWVGLSGQPLCNIFVNIVKVAPDTGARDPVFEPVIAPHFVPDSVDSDQASSLETLGITRVLNDEIFIDIAILANTDCIMMSIDSAPWMLDEKQADILMNRWSHSVKECLVLI